MNDNPDLTSSEMTKEEKARAESCRIARWHEGQGVPYDRFLNDDNTMLKQKVNPHVVVQTSSGGSRIKKRNRSVEKACDRAFEEEPGFADDYERTIIDGDLLDPEIWRRIGNVLLDGHDPVIVVGSGNDGTNLHVALTVRKQHPDAYVIARSFRTSPFTAELAQETGIHPFNLGELIESGMPDAWF